jgi:DNA polymerase III alpha subunit
MAECADCSASAKNAAAGACHLDWSDVEQWNDGLIAILSPDRADVGTEAALARTKRIFADRAYLALTIRRRPKDAIRLRDLANLAAAARVPTVATNDVLYHAAERHMLQDVVLHPGEMHDRRIGRSARAVRRSASQDRPGNGAAVPSLSQGCVARLSHARDRSAVRFQP